MFQVPAIENILKIVVLGSQFNLDPKFEDTGAFYADGH
jgi:hypothetical protein